AIAQYASYGAGLTKVKDGQLRKRPNLPAAPASHYFCIPIFSTVFDGQQLTNVPVAFPPEHLYSTGYRHGAIPRRQPKFAVYFLKVPASGDTQCGIFTEFLQEITEITGGQRDISV